MLTSEAEWLIRSHWGAAWDGEIRVLIDERGATATTYAPDGTEYTSGAVRSGYNDAIAELLRIVRELSPR